MTSDDPFHVEPPSNLTPSQAFDWLGVGWRLLGKRAQIERLVTLLKPHFEGADTGEIAALATKVAAMLKPEYNAPEIVALLGDLISAAKGETK